MSFVLIKIGFSHRGPRRGPECMQVVVSRGPRLDGFMGDLPLGVHVGCVLVILTCVKLRKS